jgi:hypothetical protein
MKIINAIRKDDIREEIIFMTAEEFEILQGLLANDIVDETMSCLHLSFADVFFDEANEEDIYDDELSAPKEAYDLIMGLR